MSDTRFFDHEMTQMKGCFGHERQWPLTQLPTLQ
jgi:hypothetical protein